MSIEHNMDALQNVRDNCESYLLELQTSSTELMAKQKLLCENSPEYKQLVDKRVKINTQINEYLEKLHNLNNQIANEFKEVKHNLD